MNTEEFLEHQKRIMIDAINETTNKNPTEGLRDYFAAMALGGLLWQGGFEYREVAECAYKVADAMLKERERGE